MPEIEYVKTVHTSTPCSGHMLSFPDHHTANSSYPFALHDKHNLPWDYELRNGTFSLRSRLCRGVASADSGGQCDACRKLQKNEVLLGIQRRLLEGVREHSPYAYHGIGGLMEVLRRKESIIDEFRLRRLNDARHLVVIEGALDVSKQIYIALSRTDCDIKRVNVTLRNAMEQNLGLHRILELVNATLDNRYHPKNYNERDDARGTLMLQLGGSRLADIAHRAFGTPATSTLRQRDQTPRLILSPAFPTSFEVASNVKACYTGIEDALSSVPIVHAVFMLDEIACERRPRFDSETNRIVGGGREYGSAASVEFRSEADLETFFDELDRGELRLASEVCISFRHSCSSSLLPHHRDQHNTRLIHIIF